MEMESAFRNTHKLIVMYKTLNYMVPVYLRDHFKISSINQAYYFTNRILCLSLPRAQTEIWKKRFAFSEAKLWNELPEEVKCCNSLHIIKKRMSSHTKNYMI